MARLHGPAGRYQAFVVQFVNAGSIGSRLVFAGSWKQARQLIIERPSCFGLREHVIVLRVTAIDLDEDEDVRRAA